MSAFLLALTGIIFFSGALFVFIVVRIGFLTIRELSSTQKSLVVARDEAIEASRLKSELLARVSHELRTPLHAILGYTDILDSDIHGPLTEKQRETIGRMSVNADQLVGQINNLLRQAQIEVGELSIQMQPMKLAELLDFVDLIIGPLAANKGLVLEFHTEKDVPEEILADPQRLREIVTNLTGNAVKFTEEGIVSIRVFRPNKGFYGIEVKDSGIGIPVADLENIFEPFRQVDGSSTRRFGGSGLGLAIAKQITKLMGGEIHVQSKEGQGSCFTVLLPLLFLRHEEAV
jgi:signal transduction histidine kinase